LRTLENTKLAILIPSLQDYDFLKLTLKSIVENTKTNIEIKIHLNAVTPEMEELAIQYDPEYTKSLSNLGISPAINICFDRSDADFIFIAESDLVFLPDWDTYLIEAMNKFGENNIFPVTKIHPYDDAQTVSLVKDYGKSPDTLDYKRLLSEVDSLRQPRYQIANCSPACFPRHLHVPFDEAYFPGWATDVEMHVNAWQLDKNVRYIKSEKSLIYHFRSLASKKFYSDDERSMQCARSNDIFNKKWEAIHPGLNLNTYKDIIMKNYKGYITE